MKILPLVLLLASAPSVAQTCGERDAARLRFLAGHLEAEAARGVTWTHAWASTYTALTIGQLAALPAIVEQDRIEWYVGAASTALGVAFVLIDPLEAIDAGPGFATRAGRVLDPEQVCGLIAEGEGLLARSAEHEAAGRRWYMHGLNVVVNIGLALILGLGVEHWVAGAVNFLVGVASAELTIFTAPNRLISVWQEYQRGELGETTPVSFRLMPMLRHDGGGLGLALNF